MAHPSGSQRDTDSGHSRLVTPPPDPAPEFAATVVSESGDNPNAEPSLPRDGDNPRFLHPATPRRAKISNINVLHKHKGYYTEMGNREMEGRYGQVGLGTFFDDYMPQPAAPLSARQLKKIGNFSRVPYSGPEVKMYGPLVRGTMFYPRGFLTQTALFSKCETFRKLHEAIKSPFKVYDTSDRLDQTNEVQDTKPDLSLYDGVHGTAKYDIDVTERTSSKVTDKMRTEYLGRTSWAWMTSFIEVKSSPQWAPFKFDDTDNLVVKDTDLGKRSRAQVIKYVSELQHRQHRKFVLCAFIWRDWVRFMRWDRAGAIVSTADNYVNDPQRLLDFIHRISTSPPEDHGYDPTVTLVKTPEPDIKKYVKEIRFTLSNKYLIEAFDEAFGNKTMDCGDYPLYEARFCSSTQDSVE